MPKMPITDFIAEVRAVDDELLLTQGVSFKVVNERVHLTMKDDRETGEEVWIYPNEDGTFTYQRGEAKESHPTVEDVVNAVFGEA